MRYATHITIEKSKRREITAFSLVEEPTKLIVRIGYFVPLRLFGFKIGSYKRYVEKSLYITDKVKADGVVIYTLIGQIRIDRDKRRKYRRTIINLKKNFENDAIRLHSAAAKQEAEKTN